MTRQQIRTAKRLALLGAAVLALLGYALVIELQGVAQGGQSTISELVWLLWANQPWVVWLVSVVAAGVVMFLAGHFVSQAADTYRQMRGDRLSSKTLDRLRREESKGD
jgi:hypothetical protein